MAFIDAYVYILRNNKFFGEIPPKKFFINYLVLKLFNESL